MKRGPSGRPDTNYFLAHHYNYQCYSDPLEDGDINEFLAVVQETPSDSSAGFGDFAEIILIKKGIEMPVNVTSGLSFCYLTKQKISHG